MSITFEVSKVAPPKGPMATIARDAVARGRNYTWTTAFTVPIEVRVA